MSILSTLGGWASSAYNAVSSLFGGGTSQSASALNYNNPVNNALQSSYVANPASNPVSNYLGTPSNQRVGGIPSYATPTSYTSSTAYGPAKPSTATAVIYGPTQPASSFSFGGGSTGGTDSSGSYSSAAYSSPTSSYYGAVQAAPVSQRVDSSTIGTGNQAIQTPSTPVGDSNYYGSAIGRNVGLGGNPQNGLLGTVGQDPNAKKKDNQQPQTFEDFLKSQEGQNYLGMQKPDANLMESRNRAMQDSQLQQAQQQMQNTQNQINSITAGMNASILNEQGQGRGIPLGVIGGRQEQISREATIKLLPLQAQLAADQGNVKMAQDNYNTLFDIYSKDTQASVDNYNKNKMAAYQYYTDKEKKQVDQILYQKNYTKSVIDSIISQQKSLVDKLYADGQYSEASRVMSIRPPSNINAPDADLQIAIQNYNRDIGNELQKAASSQSAQFMQIGQNGSSVASDNLKAYASQYSDTGSLPSPAELKAAGLSIGQVTQYAKEIPKPQGALVSRVTGIKPKTLSSAQEDGISSLFDLSKKLDEARQDFEHLNTGFVAGLAKTVFYTSAQQKYDNLKSEIVDLLARARSGAALTQDEVKNYESKLPGRFNASFGLGSSGVKSIENLKSSIEGKLNTHLNTNNLAIYGYSKVNVNGTPRTVGEILDIGGTQYRVLPDGNLTDQI